MKIALLNIINQTKNGSMNKDLAGGMGTFSNLGSSWFSKILGKIKQRYIKIPVLAFAYLQAILKTKGYEVEYLEGGMVFKEYDLVVIKGSIVDYRFETEVGQKIKNKYPKTKVIFFGAFPSAEPALFGMADSVVVGDELNFFQNEFSSIDDLPKIIKITGGVNMNDLPAPDFTGFPIHQFSYFPSLSQKPLIFLIASQGCPYSCSHYCAYGSFQGSQYRSRSPEKLIEDIKTLKEKYQIKAIQFRDPLFGLNKIELKIFCLLLIKNKLNIRFGIETRLDILDRELINLMHTAGLRNINIGVETADKSIAGKNKRLLTATKHQEEIIAYCEKIGVKIAAFYIFGLVGDTEESIRDTIDYAVKLNTHLARFGVSCPYPGTKYYKDLDQRGLITEKDFEKFDSFSMVFKHENLSAEEIEALLNQANKRYYLRFNYIINFIKWRIREFWL